MSNEPGQARNLRRLFFALLPFFVVSNGLVFALNYVDRGVLFPELIKWFQLIGLLLLLSYLLRGRLRPLGILAGTGAFFLYHILVAFRLMTGTEMNFSFLLRHLTDLDNLAGPYFVVLSGFLFVSVLNAVFLTLVSRKPARPNKLMVSLLLAGTLTVGHLPFSIGTENEVLTFAKTIYSGDRVINFYQKLHRDLTERSSTYRDEVFEKAEETRRKELPPHLDNIVVIHLESLNSFLVKEEYTPVLLELGRGGVFFPKFYSNSVQTLYGQENLLCSVPGSFELSLEQTGLDKRVLCLPEVLSVAGYYSIFVKSYDLGFTSTGDFMTNIGFDEVHADDIMRPDDPSYAWGYREDVFFERAFAHFRNTMREGRNLLYVEVGPTNHWPFNTPEGLEDQVPFPTPRSHRERLVNTTFLQDSYLAVAMEEMASTFPEDNFTLFVVGDHSWPAEFHPGNVFNQQGAFEENFVTSMVMVSGGDAGFPTRTLETRYSQMDFLPSVLDLLGIPFPENGFRRSFVPELLGESPERARILAIQPYGQRYINVIEDHIKYQYKEATGNFLRFDLTTDPEERYPTVLSHGDKDNIRTLSELLFF